MLATSKLFARAGAPRLQACENKAVPRGPADGALHLAAHLLAACHRWGENDFGLDPSSKQCAKVDGLPKPWCYFGSDDEWDYCAASCDDGQAAAPKVSEKPCRKTVSGEPCDEWGENDFGLDESSTACAQVDGLGKPWCYTSEDDWDYCDCSADDGDELTVSGVSAGGSGNDRASRTAPKAPMPPEQKLEGGGGSDDFPVEWQDTDEVDENGVPLQKMDLKALMLEGKVSRWW